MNSLPVAIREAIEEGGYEVRDVASIHHHNRYVEYEDKRRKEYEYE